MLNLTYLAVLEPGKDGSYSVSFPDLPGCFSYGKNLTEAQQMAEERKVNFSRLLETALIDYLQLPKQGGR